ncbi:NitT/TauT family transport system ATP-binding protein [Xanthobacter sp. SG618]|uniref:ABC transporter ATP-binding protein n=1 Tax=Xanthobacter sp. SG618 TaxID=2587121 RepID=UPI001845118B|nr:ABC transporter ATP-binding protein [Xanthobacter sp. SG618]NMN58243.1 NitT/TauT family transport system ATP-binding protein [Xanthobacter sp. SG618]
MTAPVMTTVEPTTREPAGGAPLPDLTWFTPGTHITIRGLTKTFRGNPVYTGFDIDFPRGGIVSIFGPNGCGKSTLINMISGILPYDAGQILFDGKTIAETRIGYVFQNYREALFPWQRAIDNIHYPLKMMGVPKAERERRIEKLAAQFDLKFDLNRYPYEMSGGQQQTVSIMRALVVDPEVLFLDEPFSALDYEMTLTMRDLLQKVLTETRTTTLLVSHDLEEAVWLSDKVLLLTRRPSRIAEYMDIDLPRPRNSETISDPRFVALKAHALEVFQTAVRSSAP